MYNSIGIHEIQIKLFGPLNMDYMFKGVKDLISIEMSTEKSCQIISMISTFENCNNLKSFNNTNFYNDQNTLISIHKLFYKSGLVHFLLIIIFYQILRTYPIYLLIPL